MMNEINTEMESWFAYKFAEFKDDIEGLFYICEKSVAIGDQYDYMEKDQQIKFPNP